VYQASKTKTTISCLTQKGKSCSYSKNRDKKAKQGRNTMQKSTRKQNKVLLDSMRKPQPSLRGFFILRRGEKVREAIQSLTTGLFTFAINSKAKECFVRSVAAALALLFLISTAIIPSTGRIWGVASDEFDDWGFDTTVGDGVLFTSAEDEIYLDVPENGEPEPEPGQGSDSDLESDSDYDPDFDSDYDSDGSNEDPDTDADAEAGEHGNEPNDGDDEQDSIDGDDRDAYAGAASRLLCC